MFLAGISVGNAFNGREHSTLAQAGNGTPDDLEYACIFPLPTPRDCAQRDPSTEACYCYPGFFDRALCEQTPGTGDPGTTQYWAKAYPGPRQLEVLEARGSNSILASICPRNTTDASAIDFGYRPAIDAVIERLAQPQP